MPIANDMKDIKEILAESYKNAISEVFKKELSFPGKDDKQSVEKMEQAMNEYLDNYETEKNNIVNSWAETPISELQGMTPSEIINGMDCINDVYDIFLYMSENTDEEVPDLLIDKMRQYGTAMSEKLVNLARSSADAGEREHVFAEIVSTIGRMGLSVSVEPLIQLLYDFREDISKSEYLEDVLKNMGEAVIEPILTVLEETEFGDIEYRLLYVLAYAGSNAKDERIYRILRKAFRETGEKLPVVVCIAAYRDGRAVPMLRSYLEKNGRDIPKQLFLVTMDTICSLGGDITDFMGMLRNRNFS